MASNPELALMTKLLKLEGIKVKNYHFTEGIGIFTKRLKNKILEEVIESDIKNVAQRNGVSEQEIETMLKDLAQDLIEEKPQGIRRLGIDEIALVKGQKNYCAVLVDLDKRVNS